MAAAVVAVEEEGGKMRFHGFMVSRFRDFKAWIILNQYIRRREEGIAHSSAHGDEEISMCCNKSAVLRPCQLTHSDWFLGCRTTGWFLN